MKQNQLAIEIPPYKKGIFGYGKQEVAGSVFVTLAQAVGTLSKSYPDLRMQDVAYTVVQRATRTLGLDFDGYLPLMELFMGDTESEIVRLVDTLDIANFPSEGEPVLTHFRFLMLSEMSREQINYAAPTKFAYLFGKDNLESLENRDLMRIMCPSVSVKTVASDNEGARAKQRDWSVWLSCALSTEFIHLAAALEERGFYAS